MTRALAERAVAAGRLAIDTEFVSEGRYQALLCLVQVAARAGEGDEVVTDVLDPIEGVEPAPLAAALADDAVEVIVHAGRQDVALMRREWKTEVTDIFDTQVAAAFLGYGAQEGYESLCQRVLGLQLRGTEGFTHWDRRPLTESQLKYAREDAAHLLELGEELRRRLVDAGRLEWAREECVALERSSDVRDPDEVYLRLPKLGRLNAEQRGVARELVDWREHRAKELGRPIGWLAPDQALVEIARRRPSSKRELEDIRGVPKRTLHKRCDDVLAAVERGRDRDAPASASARARPDPSAAPKLALAGALVRHRAASNDLAPELLATQADLKRLIADQASNDAEPDSRVLDGWRRDVVGAELLELLSGKLALRVGSDGALIVER